MSRMAPDLSGMIPLDALEAQAAGVRRLASGVQDLAGTAGDMLAGMQEVRDAGQWAEARDGLYRFEQDVMRELEAEGDADGLQARWKQALADRLPAYLPGRMSGRVKERVDMAREKLEAAGNIYLEKLSRLGQVEHARRSWAGSVDSAVEEGDAALAERRIEEGRGLFVTGDEAGRMAEEARGRVALNEAVREVRRDPAAAWPVVRAEQEGAPLNAMEKKVAQEAGAAYGELKRRYADSILRTVAGGGLLRDDGLANAEKYGLVSPTQLRLIPMPATACGRRSFPVSAFPCVARHQHPPGAAGTQLLPCAHPGTGAQSAGRRGTRRGGAPGTVPVQTARNRGLRGGKPGA